MDMLLMRIRSFFFSLGADKGFCIYDKIGNKIEDLRIKITS